jgi:protease I
VSDRLLGTRVAFIATDGVEEAELKVPLEELRKTGATVELLSPEGRDVRAFKHVDKSGTYHADGALTDAFADAYDALVLPGGVVNADALRLIEAAVDFVRAFSTAGKPMGVICHAPWLLVEAGAVEGKTVTSWPSLRTDIENAGGRWVDQEVCVDGNLVTSRKPKDLPAFCERVIAMIATSRNLDSFESETQEIA